MISGPPGVGFKMNRNSATLLNEGITMVKTLLRISTTAVSLLTGVLVQSPIMAQPQPRQKIEVSKLGPQVRERVPDFE